MSYTHCAVQLTETRSLLPPNSVFEIHVEIFCVKRMAIVSDKLVAHVKSNQMGEVVSFDRPQVVFEHLNRIVTQNDWKFHLVCRLVRLEFPEVLSPRNRRGSINDEALLVTQHHRYLIAIGTLPIAKPEFAGTRLQTSMFSLQLINLFSCKNITSMALEESLIMESINRSSKRLQPFMCVIQTPESKSKTQALLGVNVAIFTTSQPHEPVTKYFRDFSNHCICAPFPLSNCTVNASQMVELTVRIDRGTFPKKPSQNRYVVAMLRNLKGDLIENCFYSYPGSLPMSKWRTVVIEKTHEPIWSERVRLAFPIALLSDVHLYFEVFHIPEKGSPYPIGFFHIDLVDSNHALTLDSATYDVLAFPFPRMSKVSYLKQGEPKEILVDHSVTVALSYIHPYLSTSKVGKQIPTRGMDVLVRSTLDNPQSTGVCKQWLPSRLVVNGNSVTRVMMAVMKGDILMLFDVEEKWWDALKRSRSASTSSTNLSCVGGGNPPKFSIFLRDCDIRVVSADPYPNKIAIISWSSCYVFEFPSRDEQLEWIQILRTPERIAKAHTMSQRTAAKYIPNSSSMPTPRSLAMTPPSLSASTGFLQPRPRSATMTLLRSNSTTSLTGSSNTRLSMSRIDRFADMKQQTADTLQQVRANQATIDGIKHQIQLLLEKRMEASMMR